MEQKFRKDSWQWKFFQEYWRFVQAYYIPEDTDEWWDEVIDKADYLYKKYGNDFAKDMILAFLNDIDKRYRAEKEKKRGK